MPFGPCLSKRFARLHRCASSTASRQNAATPSPVPPMQLTDDKSLSDENAVIEESRLNAENKVNRLNALTQEIKVTESGPKLAIHSQRARISTQPYAADDFLMIKIIGRGSFGEVVLVVRRNSRRLLAMKILDKRQILERGLVEETRLEREVLRRVKFPFVNGMKLAFQTSTRLYIGTPYFVGGSLNDHVARFGCEINGVRFYACEIVLALAYLHERGIIHRDLKPSNILVGRDGHVAVTDFGLCGKRGQAATGFSGTIEYVAPELLRKAHTNLTCAVDFWSLGCVLYELATGVTPFAATRARVLFNNILRADIKPTKLLPSFDVLERALLDKDPARRLSFLGKLQKFSFFARVDWVAIQAKAVQPPSVPSVPDFVDPDSFRLNIPARALQPHADPDDLLPHQLLPDQNPFSFAFRGFAYRDQRHLGDSC